MWSLLVRDGCQVGFSKTVGRATLYAVEGQAFSGQPIPHDTAIPETSLRTLHGERVFAGDVVCLVSGAERVVLVEGPGRTVLGLPNSGQVESPEAGNCIQRRLGSVHTHPYYRRAYAWALSAGPERVTGPAVRAGLATLTGGAVSGAVQFWVAGSVGPIVTMMGSVVALCGALGYESKAGRRLKDRFLLGVATRAALGNAVTLALLYFLSRRSTEPEALVGTFAASALGFLGTFALVTMVGNAVDHYGHDRAVPSNQP